MYVLGLSGYSVVVVVVMLCDFIVSTELNSHYIIRASMVPNSQITRNMRQLSVGVHSLQTLNGGCCFRLEISLGLMNANCDQMSDRREQ